MRRDFDRFQGRCVDEASLGHFMPRVKPQHKEERRAQIVFVGFEKFRDSARSKPLASMAARRTGHAGGGAGGGAMTRASGLLDLGYGCSGR